LVASEFAVERQLHEPVEMHVLDGRHCQAGTQIDDRASGVRPVSERSLIRTLAIPGSAAVAAPIEE